MAEEEKDASEFLNEVEQEGGKAFEETTEEKETPTESSTEKEPTKESPSSQGEEDSKKEEVETPKEESIETKEKPLPFDQHPSWIKRVDENRELREKLDKLQEGVEKDRLQVKEQQKDQTIPVWFSAANGDDPRTWQEFQARESNRDQRIKDEIRQEQQDIVEKQQQETNKWSEWVETEVQTLVSEGKKFDKNELMTIVGKYKPTDEKGNLDFHLGYEIMTDLQAAKQAKKAVKTQEKKEVGAQTMDEGSKGEEEKKDFMTSRELKNMGWNDFNN